MDQGNAHDQHYWQLLSAAEAALARGDHAACERLLRLATSRREESPGRVFLTEKLRDGLTRLLKRGSGPAAEAGEAGRWARRTAALRESFLRRGETVVREGVRLAELRPEDDAEANQPILETALYLVSRSRIFGEEPASAVPLLKGLFRTARRTGRPFDVQLVRHDLPLTEEDRLWLARRGGELLEAFLEQGLLGQGTRESQEWSGVFLQLLQPRYFGSTSRLQEERAWLEAITADRLLGHAADSVRLYRDYLGVNPEPGPRPDEARVRLLELLGNIDARHFPVPRYAEALGAMQSAGLAAGSAVAGRYQAALACLEFRRPPAGRNTPGGCWATVAPDSEGCLVAVLWWGAQPRDLARWRPGEDPGPLDEFLAPCEDRILAAERSVLPVVTGIWAEEPPVWTVRDFAAALLEPLLPAAGLETAALRRLAVAETGPWRAGWLPHFGHPDLKPPQGSPHAGEPLVGPAAAALEAGLLWLAVRSRVDAADPSLSGGIGELARRGDPAASFLYDFLALEGGAQRVVDATFEPWTLPLLWTRPDPQPWRPGGGGAGAAADDARPDLGRNDLALVGTGDPAAVLAAWGEGRQKWRVVLDRPDRFDVVSGMAGRIIGPITLIPACGAVHSLAGALDLLEDLLADPADRRRDALAGLVPLFHWARLVETHNGDLLDFRELRPRPGAECPLHLRYAEIVLDLEREAPSLAGDQGRRSWAGQFSQRVRKAGLVAGHADLLTPDPQRLDSLWGVFEGSDASWVFLDSAAIHWSLWRRTGLDLRRLHGLLHSRGRRHLSLLTGAVWRRDDLDALLASWLQVFGSPYRLTLLDGPAPALHLAERGAAPDAVHHGAEALLPAAAHVETEFTRAGGGCLLLPASGRAAAFWQAVAAGEIPLARSGWHFLPPGAAGGPPAGIAAAPRLPLAVPVLGSLEGLVLPRAAEDTPAAWRLADRDRRETLERGRQLCSLELAALLAGPWSAVEVLDVRWRRLALPEDGPADGAGRSFALPEISGRGRSAAAAWLEPARDWLRRHPADPAAAAAEPTDLPLSGLQLVSAEGPSPWPACRRRLEAAWELEEPGPWLLLISDEAPEGARELAARSGSGFTAWPPADPRERPGMVLWVRIGDFLDPALAALLEDRPPALALARGAHRWLPAAGHDAQEGALALRTLLGARVPLILLEAARLPGPWVRFLQATAGAVLSPGSAAEAPSLEPAAGPPATGPLCLDCGLARTPAARLERLRCLLARLRRILEVEPLPAGQTQGRTLPGPGSRLLPLPWLEWLAGLPAPRIREGAQVLRWAARLAGDPLSLGTPVAEAGAADGEGHSLLIPQRFAEIENRLLRLEGQLQLLLPLWLQGLRSGATGWIDLAFPPARLPEAELAEADRLLSMLGSAAAAPGGLLYRCPRGALNSTRRLVGATAPPATVLAALGDRLRLFRARIREVLAAAEETGEGFLVRTGLRELRPDERDFLALGAVLGLWRWYGPAGSGAVSLVDLLTLADSATAQGRGEAWSLLQALQEEAAGPAEAGTAGTTAGGRGGLRKGWLPLPGARDETDSAQRRVAGVCGAEADARFLVLRGLAGTGRHETLLGGLARAVHECPDLGEVTVYCPDAGAAAVVAGLARRLRLAGRLDLRVVEGADLPPPVQATDALLADTAGQVIVLCEIQRFAPETRYRLAQLGRGRRLLLTVDPAAAVEPWENLFLTTPRAADVITLEAQRRLARRPWSEVRLLVGDQLAGRGAALRKDKGLLVADYAANLDQCLARLLQEREGGRLPDRLRLTGALPTDLEYLGARLREHGWLVIDEEELAFLLLPGVSEFLAAATDELVRAGGLRPAADPQGAAEMAAAPAPPPLLAPLLGPEAAVALARRQAAAAPPDEQTPLTEFLAGIQAEPWAATFLAHPAARERVAELLRRWPGESLGGLPRRPQWEGWRSVLMEELDLPRPLHRRPLVTVTTAERPGTTWTPGGVYLCRGSEPDRRHYAVLGRITDSALILYQERSPLPGDAAR